MGDTQSGEDQFPDIKEENQKQVDSDDDDEDDDDDEVRRRISSSGPNRAQHPHHTYVFRPFTQESLKKIAKRIEREAKKAKKRQEQLHEGTPGDSSDIQATDKKEELAPNPMFEIGKTLPSKVGEFPPSLFGRPIEDLDDYYRNKYTFMIVAKDKTIFRFSATKGFFIFDPFNPVRRAAMYVLTHPFFSLTVMVVILINCIFMASNEEIPAAEKTFTGIYTVEGCVKMLARGFILADFTYLRDAWNWLDFIVVVLAYVTNAVELGNVAVLRTFRVLRALKTVAVVPGLKTIVGALMEAVRRLRDVMILSLFVLSIFALVGLQLYQGSMMKKCVKSNSTYMSISKNSTAREKEEYFNYVNNTANWFKPDSKPFMLCGALQANDAGGTCPPNYTCITVGDNPDFGYTHFDNFGSALLCAFRLMTQDNWESLYQQVIRTNGPNQMLFFVIVIFLGSFYLVNVILAIVAMSYDDCRKQDQIDADLEAEEEAELADIEAFFECKRTPSVGSARSLINPRFKDDGHSRLIEGDRLSMHSEYCNSKAMHSPDNKYNSVPGTPFLPQDLPRRRSSQFSWKRPSSRTSLASWKPAVMPYLDNLDLPYADDSEAVTPSSEDICNFHNAHYYFLVSPSNGQPNRRRPSCSGNRGRPTQTEGRFLGGNGVIYGATPLRMLPLSNGNSANAHNLQSLSGTPVSHFPLIPNQHTLKQQQQLQHQRRNFPPLALQSTTTAHYGLLNNNNNNNNYNNVNNNNNNLCTKTNSYLSSIETPQTNNTYLDQCAMLTSGSKEWDSSVTSGQIKSFGPLIAIKQPFYVNKPVEPTHFHWNIAARNKRNRVPSGEHAIQAIALRGRSFSGDQTKNKMSILDNPFICRTPSVTTIDIQDVLVLKDLFKNASRKRGVAGFLGFEPGMKKKEFIKKRCMQLLFDWQCHPLWYKIANIIELFIMDAFVDLFITLCIVVNTVFMAVEHANMNDSLVKVLSYGNYVFTGIFSVEAALKILALGLYKYLQDKWSCFDFVIVILSLIEMGLEKVKGLSILRSFRLLRVFKLAKSWPTLNLLIGIIGRTMGALGNLCFVLAIIIFIFAVMGMQLFGSSYHDDRFPFLPGESRELRWHFKDFFHSFMIVFRILCGEWIDNMWNCLRAYGKVCIPFFLLTMIVGNLVVLNLFLALLLSSFGAESLKHSQEDEGPNKLQEAIDRINRFVIYIKSHITYCIKVKIRHKGLPADYYYDDRTNCIDPQDEGEISIHREIVIVNATPIGNGRVREAEVDNNNEGSPQHYNNNNDSNVPGFIIHLDKGRSNGRSPHVGYSPVYPTEPDEYTLKKQTELINLNCGVSMLSEQSTMKMSKTSSHNSQLSRYSFPKSLSTKDSLQSPEPSITSTTDTDFSFSQDDTLSRDDQQALNGPEINEVNVVFVKYPDDCCPRLCIEKCSVLHIFEHTVLGQTYWKFRCHMFSLVENNYFETFIIIMILASSMALAVEDKHIDEIPWLKNSLKIMDRIFTVIFVFEMIVKMAAYGFKKYFTDAWCWLDFVIVAISLVGWFAEGAGAGNMGAFRALRTLRALRPLRAVSRWEGMKVVVNALIQAIPAIFNVLLVCLVFWLIFSIMGVNLFMGRFGRCVDENGEMIKMVLNQQNHLVIQGTNDTLDRELCEKNYSVTRNYTWFIPKVTFDNVLIGYLSLFQIATFKGWMDIMYAAVDSREPTDQPMFEDRIGVYLYFVLFIVFGSFFTLNLFIGVIIENFNMQKKKAGGSMEMLMTEDQKKYYNAMKKLGSKQPSKPIPKPKFMCQLFFFNLTKNQKFDVAIMVVILLNMATMAMEHHDEPKEMETALTYINNVFIVIFTMECVMKILGLRFYYFKEPWNVFDFVVVVTSLLTMALSEYMKMLPVSPTMLRVVRVFRVGRVLRLVKSAKGIRTLLFSLAVSMPALFNIGLLLFLVMFIYAIVGMSSFMHVKHTAGLDDMFNFETFFNSMIILFQICTSAGWDSVLAGLMNDTPPDCDDQPSDKSPNGDCGNSAMGMMFLVTYLVITFLVVINMYIAVILENFSQATEDVQQGLTQDDFDMYYELWERYDEKASQYIPLDKLCEFVDALEDPLRLPAPNIYKLVSMNIPICEGDKVHCVDILDALTKNFLGTTDTAGDLSDLKGPEKQNYHPISSTLKRQREMYVARVIQKTWRSYAKKKRLAHAKEDLEKLDAISLQSYRSGS